VTPDLRVEAAAPAPEQPIHLVARGTGEEPVPIRLEGQESAAGPQDADHLGEDGLGLSGVDQRPSAEGDVEHGIRKVEGAAVHDPEVDGLCQVGLGGQPPSLGDGQPAGVHGDDGVLALRQSRQEACHSPGARADLQDALAGGDA